jgi:hypothetical protein
MIFFLEGLITCGQIMHTKSLQRFTESLPDPDGFDVSEFPNTMIRQFPAKT